MFDVIDTDFWSEIQDCEGEIYDYKIPELNEEEFNFDSYLNGEIDY